MGHIICPCQRVNGIPITLRFAQDTLIVELVLHELLVVHDSQKVLSFEPFVDLLFTFASYGAGFVIAAVEGDNKIGGVRRVVISPKAYILRILNALEPSLVSQDVALCQL